MSPQNNFYSANGLIHKNRRLGETASSWVAAFCCADLHPLIVCRGPIRKEAMDVFEEMGMTHYGILLSEKDAIVYTHALAPELRQLTDPLRIHRVPDYSGTGREERLARMDQIIAIAREGGYNAIFAGYGFMAEDETFVAAIERAGLYFIGPCAATVENAGRKDQAKRTALAVGVSVTPGIDNVTARALLVKYPNPKALETLARERELSFDPKQKEPPEESADRLLQAGYQKGIDLLSTDEIAEQVRLEVAAMFRRFPGCRVRLKAIGGGGGKGQRILEKPDSQNDDPEAAIERATQIVPERVREVLSEVKATGVGDNKNMLVELNIEETRHQEIQLLGNGEWCVSLGARDCSLQMHEQKLLEVSVTHEALKSAIGDARSRGASAEVTALTRDLTILGKMEDEATRFGLAVGLDSASTFECIVDRGNHFFMEMNTRIQVEHRVSELCYALKFTNPEDPRDFFAVDSLVEAMALLARHKTRLPKPQRIRRKNDALEARLNATDASLAPHAGGIISFWSDPIENEIRDDQGICLKNPDTDRFMKYHIAGAYDSNIALLITHGEDRHKAYERLAELLRRTKLSGVDLATNLEFHYGLINWFRGQNVQARPTTRFMLPYLTQVGALKAEIDQLDLGLAFRLLTEGYAEAIRLRHESENPELCATLLKANQAVLNRKQSLLLRPLRKLMANPHLLSGWLSLHRHQIQLEHGVRWLENPVFVLEDIYHFLNMDYRADHPAAEVIWDHDHELLERMKAFYANLGRVLKTDDYQNLTRALDQEIAPAAALTEKWNAIRGAHEGYQRGLELLGILPGVAKETGFYQLRVEPDLSIHIPNHLFEADSQAKMKKILAPPPATKADEIVAVCGGMYYPREAPGLPVYTHEGGHFQKGDPLYIIEVMKMFNKVYAPFSGTVDHILVGDEDGVIVTKGQPLFKVTPDERIIEEDPVEVGRRRQSKTRAYLESLKIQTEAQIHERGS